MLYTTVYAVTDKIYYHLCLYFVSKHIVIICSNKPSYAFSIFINIHSAIKYFITYFKYAICNGIKKNYIIFIFLNICCTTFGYNLLILRISLFCDKNSFMQFSGRRIVDIDTTVICGQYINSQ